MLIIPEFLTSGIGLVLICIIWFIQKKRPEEVGSTKVLAFLEERIQKEGYPNGEAFYFWMWIVT